MTDHEKEPASWPYKPEQLEPKPCETGSQCIGGKCFECEEKGKVNE